MKSKLKSKTASKQPARCQADTQKQTTEIRPSEVTLVALVLSHQQGLTQKPQFFFPAAVQLIREANSFLTTDWDASSFEFIYGPYGQFPFGLADDLEKLLPEFEKREIPIPFDTLLRPVTVVRRGKKSTKKERTILGAITKEIGLCKAVKLHFSKSIASDILRAKSLTVQQLLELRTKRNITFQKRARHDSR